MDERRINELKRIDELKMTISNNIKNDIEFINNLKSFGNTLRDYKQNSFEIFNLISNKFDENSNEIAELWFLETTKDFACVEDVLK